MTDDTAAGGWLSDAALEAVVGSHRPDAGAAGIAAGVADGLDGLIRTAEIMVPQHQNVAAALPCGPDAILAAAGGRVLPDKGRAG